MKQRLLHKDFVVGILCVVVSAFFGWQSMHIRASLNSGDPGGRLFPLIGCGLLFLCGIALLLRKPPEATAAFLTKPQWKRAAILFSLYILNYLLLWLGGFLVAAPVVLAILCYLFTAEDAVREKKVRIIVRSVIYGVAVGGVIYVLYKYVLDAQMPAGIIWRK